MLKSILQWASRNFYLMARDAGFDHLHPNAAAYKAMANSIDLTLLGVRK
jgi:lysophospholipase L1-like esterase